MPPPRSSAASSSSSPLTTAYSLSLLSEYTHSLDALPLDLSRNFADLRELDAVLSSSMITIVAKIRDLTLKIEQGSVSHDDRIVLLHDIADEARRLKLGGEDKIRVACQAADNLKGHSNHMRALAEHLPGFDMTTLIRKTNYPHVASRSFMPYASLETGRRRRGGFGSLLVANNTDPSPAKRKRSTRDEDVDIGLNKSPRKEKLPEAAPRSRNNGKKKAESPSESLVSVTSHLHSQVSQSNSRVTATNNSVSRLGNPSSSTSKRSRANANNSNASPTVNDRYPSPNEQHAAGNTTNGHNTNSRREPYNVPPTSLPHPSLPSSFVNNGPVNGLNVNGFDSFGMSHRHTNGQDWNIPLVQQLEGPGMPVARSASIHSSIANVPAVATSDGAAEAGDGEGDNDDKIYCFCDGVSYGEMIACDDEHCEREWFHLACIGLSVPPQGRWFCETCKGKRNAKRAVRGGKRRATTNRSGAKGS